MLLFDFVDNDGFGTGILERLEQYSSRDGDEEEDIEENKKDKENIDPKRVPHCHHLIIGVRVIG